MSSRPREDGLCCGEFDWDGGSENGGGWLGDWNSVAVATKCANGDVLESIHLWQTAQTDDYELEVSTLRTRLGVGIGERAGRFGMTEAWATSFLLRALGQSEAAAAGVLPTGRPTRRTACRLPAAPAGYQPPPSVRLFWACSLRLLDRCTWTTLFRLNHPFAANSLVFTIRRRPQQTGRAGLARNF